MKKRLKQAVILLMVVILVGTICPMTALAAPERVPAKVSGIKASASKGSVKVRWKKAKNATSYRICYRPFNSKKWKALKTVSSKTTSYTHKNSRKYPLKAGKRYYYTVKAYNKSSRKWGRYDTKGKSVTIPKAEKKVSKKVPGKVSGIKVSPSKSSEDSVKIRWKKAKNATSYRICYRPFNSKKWKTLKTVNGKTTGYIHKNSKKNPLKVGRRYYYTVKAYNKYSGKWGKYDTRGASIKLSSEWKKGQSWEYVITDRGEIDKGGNTWESGTW